MWNKNYKKNRENASFNKILEITIRNCIVDDNNNKKQIKELKGSLDIKSIQAETWNITIAST